MKLNAIAVTKFSLSESLDKIEDRLVNIYYGRIRRVLRNWHYSEKLNLLIQFCQCFIIYLDEYVDLNLCIDNSNKITFTLTRMERNE